MPALAVTRSAVEASHAACSAAQVNRAFSPLQVNKELIKSATVIVC